MRTPVSPPSRPRRRTPGRGSIRARTRGTGSARRTRRRRQRGATERFTFYARRLDWAARLDALRARYDIDEAQRDRLAALLEVLRDDPTAPSTVREPEQAVDVHVADSLVSLELAAVRDARALADIGSGAGFPGLPLALALPDARVSLVESSSRKCAFLERAVQASGAANASVACARVEEWPVRDLDVVCVRAVAPLPVLVEYAAPLLRLGGRLVAWKGRHDEDEERNGAAAAARL